MPLPRGLLLCLSIVLMAAGGGTALGVGLAQQSAPLFALGLFLAMGGVALLVSGICMAMKNLQVGVPGHSLLHPRTGTRFSPQQALAIQRRLDRIRREMSEGSVRTAEPEPPLPSTPPPWTMEPPPSYDTVMQSQQHSERL